MRHPLTVIIVILLPVRTALNIRQRAAPHRDLLLRELSSFYVEPF